MLILIDLPSVEKCHESTVCERTEEKNQTEVRAQNASSDILYTAEQFKNLTRRMINHASMQKCRRKRRLGANRFEPEREALTHENDILRRFKFCVKQTGVYIIF